MSKYAGEIHHTLKDEESYKDDGKIDTNASIDCPHCGTHCRPFRTKTLVMAGSSENRAKNTKEVNYDAACSKCKQRYSFKYIRPL